MSSTEVTANLGRMHGFGAPTSKALGSELNLKDGVWDANLYRPPAYHVYIFTVSDREFLVSQPPLFPRLIIRPRAQGERATLVATLPAPFNQIDREGAVGDLMVRAHPAERVAQSICNPNNVTLNQDAIPPEASISGIGVDLNAQGVFWSLNNPPTEDEIKAAEMRRERYYRVLLERARTLEISNPRELENLLNQDYHLAAEFFGVETSWHKKLVKFEACPACGGQMKPGVVIHAKPDGCGAVLDWDRAIALGMRKAADRPTVSTGSRD